MAKASTHAKRARQFLVAALNDLDRGDRLDAIDAARFAVKELEASRAATFKELEQAKA